MATMITRALARKTAAAHTRSESPNVLALGRPHAAAYTSVAHALHDLGQITYLDENSFAEPFECLRLVREEAFDVVVMPNPYGNEVRLDIYRLLRETGVPIITFDRGGLPRSWFFDVGFNADSASYHVRNWDRPLSDDQRTRVRNHIRSVRTHLVALEDQGPRIGAARLRQQLGLVGRKVLFVPLQRPSDTTVRFFSAPMRDFDEFVRLVGKVSELMSTEQSDWVVLTKRHPLETTRPELGAEFAPDDTHINDLIELADAVLVLNSGTGLLSLCWDKPVLIAGTAYYADERLNTQVRSAGEVSAALSNLRPVDAETRDRFIYHLINSIYSFGTFDTELVRQPDGAWRNITRRIDFDTVRFPSIQKRASILFVTSVIPWPITRGAAHRTDQMLRVLSTQRFAVDLLCLNQNEPTTTDEEIAIRLRQQYPGLRHVMVLRHPKFARSLSLPDLARRIGYRIANLADQIAGRANTINCAAHNPPIFTRHLNARLRKVAYSAIWFNYLRVVPRDLATAAKVICDLHDYQTERIKADVLPKLRESLREGYLQRFRSSEAQALRRCDLAIAISSAEMQRMIETLKPQPRMVCFPASDFARVPTTREQQSKPDYDLLFVGSRSDANIVGLTWFLQDCFPRITTVLPRVRLRVHGTVAMMPSVTKMVAQLQNGQNITLTGPTETMDEVYSSSRIVVCPIRHGTGMKIKMVEAMAYGKAIVATSKAGEGIAIDLGLEFIDTPEAFSDTCVHLLGDPDALALRARSALATFKRDHEQGQLAQRLGRLLGEMGVS